MAESILKLNNLRKVYIVGNLKTAKKAQKEIQKLHKKYERICCQEGTAYKEVEKELDHAQKLFSEEKYEESYTYLTRRGIKRGRRDKGVVVHALNGVNLDIKSGEMVAIMGPSGSGKSTLLNMLGLLDTPTTGQIFLRGKNVTSIKNSKLPNIRSTELGFVFQSFNLIPTLTAIENVMLPLKYSRTPIMERRRLAEEALDMVGLSDRMHHTPNELSGGQKQRVAIARSIVNKPAIIFGDELTGELDTKMTKEVMQLVVDLNKKGQTFIIVTHNPEVAKLCGRTITIIDGKVAK
ncbi:MAG: ABC transporter ATP-binding protein [Candidatus Saccharibacteria bacterium]|nr:ABC transporter ATP-binding protein [Candidatus Saccharibacteria bacterium]